LDKNCLKGKFNEEFNFHAYLLSNDIIVSSNDLRR
jgi:hypothetical protein